MRQIGMVVAILLVGISVEVAASDLDRQMQGLVRVVKAMQGTGGVFDAGNMETELYYSSKVVHSKACGLQVREQQLATHKTSEITESRVTEYVLDFELLKLLSEKKKARYGFPRGAGSIVLACVDDGEKCIGTVDGKTRATSKVDALLLKVQDAQKAAGIVAAVEELIDECD